jgi:integrase
LNARTGQDGTVYQMEGRRQRRQDERWLPELSCYVRLYFDAVGKEGRDRKAVPLGKHANRRSAERARDKFIMNNGINNKEVLADALQPVGVTFRQQAAWMLQEMNAGRLKCRQKNKRGQKIDGNTLSSYKSAIAYLNTKIGDVPMAMFDNEEMRTLIASMENEPKRSRKTGEVIDGRRFGPKTICNYFQITKSVFDTAKDRKAKKLFPRDWDLNYVGLPAVNKHEQSCPTLEGEQIEQIISSAKPRYKVVLCLLPGTGLRISEALALEVGKHLSPDCSVMYIRQQRKKNGHTKAVLKSENGKRDVDVHPDLAALLRKYIGNRKDGFLFRTETGTMFDPGNLDRDFFKPILKKMGVYVPGSRFHIFRRFRESVLQASDVRNMLIDYWTGHANGEMGARYAKQLLENVAWRQQQVAKAGLGFSLPELSIVDGQDGQVLAVAEQQAVAV